MSLKKRYEHFASYDWVGAFWVPNNGSKFSGHLSYTSEDGVVLRFMYFQDCLTNVYESNILFGILDSGEKCTVFGQFAPGLSGSSFDGISIGHDSFSMDFIVFGEHRDPATGIHSLELELTNLQEFCHPFQKAPFVKFSDEPVFSVQANGTELSILQSASITPAGRFVDNVFYCKNKSIEAGVSEAITSVAGSQTSETLYLVNDVTWMVRLRFECGEPMPKVLEHIYDVEGLFSLLAFSPVRRKVVYIRDQCEGYRRSQVLVSLFDMSKHKIALLKKRISHHYQPINLRTEKNIGSVCRKWLESSDDYQLFFPQVMDDFGRITDHEIKAKMILSLTQLESLASRMPGVNGRNKYDLPIGRHPKVRDALAEKLELDDWSKIGVELSRLRGEVAHIGKGKSIAKRIGEDGVYWVGVLLEVLIASLIYEELGVSPENIEKFQLRFDLIRDCTK